MSVINVYNQYHSVFMFDCDSPKLLNNKLHCLDGPAATSKRLGNEYWAKNGKLHRIDGPATTNKNGSDGTQYYIEGIPLTKSEFDNCIVLDDGATRRVFWLDYTGSTPITKFPYLVYKSGWSVWAKAIPGGRAEWTKLITPEGEEIELKDYTIFKDGLPIARVDNCNGKISFKDVDEGLYEQNFDGTEKYRWFEIANLTKQEYEEKKKTCTKKLGNRTIFCKKPTDIVNLGYVAKTIWEGAIIWYDGNNIALKIKLNDGRQFNLQRKKEDTYSLIKDGKTTDLELEFTITNNGAWLLRTPVDNYFKVENLTDTATYWEFKGAEFESEEAAIIASRASLAKEGAVLVKQQDSSLKELAFEVSANVSPSFNSLPTRIAISTINHQLDKMVPHPSARAVLQYAAGSKIEGELGKELRVQALTNLGFGFLDMLGAEFKKNIKMELLQELQGEPALEVPKEEVLVIARSRSL